VERDVAERERSDVRGSPEYRGERCAAVLPLTLRSHALANSDKEVRIANRERIKCQTPSKRRTDGRTVRPSVRPSLRWSLTLIVCGQT